MTARPTSFRESSAASISSRSRRSSITSVRDIFSDDYALEPIDANLNFSLADLDEDEDDTDHDLPGQTSNITVYPAVPQRLSTIDRPSSTFKGSGGGGAAAGGGLRSIGNDSLLGRTLSTSSRISLPRSQSPYSGPTAPSHPYAMYPQVTRTSSIASQSTFRPQERPFVHTGGPEHPYALYPQNTVVDDDDEDIGTQPIPLGFSAIGYGPSRDGSSTEVGDIVLSDGHIEQLPPYTRYADNVVAKGDMATINNDRHVEMDTTSSERTTLMSADAVTSAEVPAAEQDVQQISSEEAAKKQGLREKLHRRVCGGIALWLLLTVVVFVFFAGILGGVIGGVVGREQGAATAKATQTIFMDADPVTYDPNIPSCPTGKYTIPFGRTQEIPACVADPAYVYAWGCLDIAYLGMTIDRDDKGIPNVRFDDYSVNTEQFMYGPQPPDFNGTVIPLGPHKDKDNKDLGVAMFFYHEFDKLNILPDWALTPDEAPDGMRTVKPREVFARGNPWDRQRLNTGEKPWYCFWNQTISEFWIFLEKPANSSDNSTITSSATPASSTSFSTTTATSLDWSVISGKNYQPTGTPAYPAAAVVRPPWSNKHYQQESKRSYTAPYYPEYPKLVKMVEKRRPTDNVRPYCQRMQVLDDWRIVPKDDEKYIIDEKEWDTEPVVTGRKRDTTMQLESNCVCEWMSGANRASS